MEKSLAVESLFSIIEGPKSTEDTSLDQINHETMQDFLSKIAIWNFYEMTREEYTNKSQDDKKLLILKYYNQLVSGISLLFVFLLFGVCCLISTFGLVPITKSAPVSDSDSDSA